MYTPHFNRNYELVLFRGAENRFCPPNSGAQRVAVAHHAAHVREPLGIDQRGAVGGVKGAVDALSARLPV